jgi:hypothetical protein
VLIRRWVATVELVAFFDPPADDPDGDQAPQRRGSVTVTSAVFHTEMLTVAVRSASDHQDPPE